MQWSSSRSLGSATFDLAHRRCMSALSALHDVQLHAVRSHLSAVRELVALLPRCWHPAPPRQPASAFR